MTPPLLSPHEDTSRIRHIFNEMADEYDDMRDCWYPYLFDSLDRIILQNFGDLTRNTTVLDVGCGTGRQTFLFAGLGAIVTGIDIADELLRIARRKAGMRSGRVQFALADATRIPFPTGSFDVVNCCGSTLSLIPDYRTAIGEMARVLKPGGRMIVDVENKWNLDMIWEWVSALFGDFLHYHTSLTEATSHFRPPLTRGYYVEYPFQKLSGDIVPMRIRLFTASELRSALHQVNVLVVEHYGIHILTNILPSTALHSPSAGRPVRTVFRTLSNIEAAIQHMPVLNHLGNDLVLIGYKAGGQAGRRHERTPEGPEE